MYKINQLACGAANSYFKTYLLSRPFVPVLILFSAQDFLFSFPDRSYVDAVESCFCVMDFGLKGRNLFGYFTGQYILSCAKEEIIRGFVCTYLHFDKSKTLLEIRPNYK